MAEVWGHCARRCRFTKVLSRIRATELKRVTTTDAKVRAFLVSVRGHRNEGAPSVTMPATSPRTLEGGLS